jgi:hypothetical protein
MERENRKHGNQEKGKEEKEALREVSVSNKQGTRKRPLSFSSTEIPLSS